MAKKEKASEVPTLIGVAVIVTSEQAQQLAEWIGAHKVVDLPTDAALLIHTLHRRLARSHSGVEIDLRPLD